MEHKRRSQVVPQYKSSDIVTDDVLNPKQHGGDGKHLDDVEV
jgi:hypothetical protein